jgi:hypothetical protein
VKVHCDGDSFDPTAQEIQQKHDRFEQLMCAFLSKSKLKRAASAALKASKNGSMHIDSVSSTASA